MKTIGVTLVLASVAAAQTFVVDVNNGPGTHYTQIAAAVAAVPDGAVLEVRSGIYDRFQIRNKSLTVIGEPGVVVSGLLAQAAIDVVDLASDQSVALRGLSWAGIFGIGAGDLVCRGNAGTVIIDDCMPVVGGGRVIFFDCDRAFVRNCLLYSGSVITAALESFVSNLVITGSEIRSNSLCLRQSGGRVQLTDCLLEIDTGLAFGQAANFMAGGDLLVNGATTISSQLLTPGPAVAGTGTVALDPDTVLSGHASPTFDPNLVIENRAIPRLDASTGPLGGTATATLAVAASGTGVLYAGFAATPVFVPGLEDPLWLGNAARQAIGGAPTVTASYAVPNASWALGVQITWRGAVLDGAGSVALSNPSAYVHYP